MRLLLVLLLMVPVAAAQDPSSSALRPDGSSAAAPAPAAPPQAERIAQGLNAAVNLAFSADGSLHYGEWKTGDVIRLGADGSRTKVLDVGEPAWGNERGFVGLAIEPGGSFWTFTTYAKADGSWFNRVSRWDGGTEVPILDQLPAGDWHNAGRIHVDPRDGTVWVAYGDVNTRPAAQDPQDLRGKILHITRDGGPVDGRMWHSLGHRQPFGFAVDFATGRVMVAENMDQKNDEVGLVERGANHGWPECEGPCQPANGAFVDPILHYPLPIGPTSGAFLGGDFYFGDFNRGHLHRIFEEDGRWFDQIVYAHEGGPILDLKPGPEGNTLYFSSWAEIWKLTFPQVEPDPQPGPGPDRPPEAAVRSPIPLPALAAVAAVLLAGARRR